ARATFTADRTIAKYVITDVIGRGGWSVVYRGMHMSLNMPVAIKMLRHHMAMEADFLGKFRNEARTIASLNHQNLVKVYDIEQLYRTVFIIMELLDGASVQDMLRTAPRLPVDQAVDILLQTCAGLGYAHQQGIVHGDVKPGNIFIQKNRIAKILDFGVACSTGTKADRLMGTPKYFSPEQIRMKAIDHRSDIYSLGLAAFRMVTGQEAFFDMDVATLCQMHLYEDTPDPRSLVPDLPDELVNIISKATQKGPAERYQEIEEMADDLQRLARRLGVPLSTEPRKHGNMMGLFLFYREEQGEIIKRLVQDFTRELKKIGADLRETDFKQIS
ncbi:MAG: serine/threonine protein kinase, partial [Deltaproteobacteria bacterium]|nr:serine/threonine protein kinase [Deltaproteobacteria bacterium]